MNYLWVFLGGGLASTAKSEAVLPAYLLGLVVAGVFGSDSSLDWSSPPVMPTFSQGDGKACFHELGEVKSLRSCGDGVPR